MYSTYVKYVQHIGQWKICCKVMSNVGIEYDEEYKTVESADPKFLNHRLL